jgi:hypothetical protein
MSEKENKKYLGKYYPFSSAKCVTLDPFWRIFPESSIRRGVKFGFHVNLTPFTCKNLPVVPYRREMQNKKEKRKSEKHEKTSLYLLEILRTSI